MQIDSYALNETKCAVKGIQERFYGPIPIVSHGFFKNKRHFSDLRMEPRTWHYMNTECNRKLVGPVVTDIIGDFP